MHGVTGMEEFLRACYLEKHCGWIRGARWIDDDTNLSHSYLLDIVQKRLNKTASLPPSHKMAAESEVGQLLRVGNTPCSSLLTRAFL